MPMNPVLSPGVREVTVRRRGQREERDLVVVEEPLEIRVDGRPLVVTMRTPGHDEELAAGFLYAEGVITSGAGVVSLRAVPGDGSVGTRIKVTSFAGDRVEAALANPSIGRSPASAEREFRATAACGVCGKESIADLEADLPSIAPSSADPSCSNRCLIVYARPRRSSRQPAASTPPGSSRWTASCCASVRTSAVTTRSTR